MSSAPLLSDAYSVSGSSGCSLHSEPVGGSCSFTPEDDLSSETLPYK